MRRILVLAVSLSCGLAAPALADCPPAALATATTIAEAWAARTPLDPAPAVADDAGALCVQVALVGLMADRAGAPAGWKVGLTSPAAQQAFGVTQPVAGRLFAGMLQPAGGSQPRGFGARPVVEADLIVTVSDAAIMQATTPLEALAHLDTLIPFIELADLMVAPGQPLDAEIITAINVGARSGIAGAPVPMQPTQDWLDALGTMTVRIDDGAGTVIGEFPGAAILGNPINAVIWLIDRLDSTGRSLEAGDRISLGSFGPPMNPADLTDLRVSYLGLPGGAKAEVATRFE